MSYLNFVSRVWVTRPTSACDIADLSDKAFSVKRKIFGVWNVKPRNNSQAKWIGVFSFVYKNNENFSIRLDESISFCNLGKKNISLQIESKKTKETKNKIRKNAAAVYTKTREESLSLSSFFFFLLIDSN